jgi:hypothetical protein
VPSGARPESGNWVTPNELGNELGNDEREASATYYVLIGDLLKICVHSRLFAVK